MTNDTIEKFLPVGIDDWAKPEFFHHANGIYTKYPKHVTYIHEGPNEYQIIGVIKLTTCAETGNILSVELVNKEIQDANQ